MKRVPTRRSSHSRLETKELAALTTAASSASIKDSGDRPPSQGVADTNHVQSSHPPRPAPARTRNEAPRPTRGEPSEASSKAGSNVTPSWSTVNSEWSARLRLTHVLVAEPDASPRSSCRDRIVWAPDARSWARCRAIRRACSTVACGTGSNPLVIIARSSAPRCWSASSPRSVLAAPKSRSAARISSPEKPGTRNRPGPASSTAGSVVNMMRV